MGASDGTEFLLGLSFCGAVLGVVTGGAFSLAVATTHTKKIVGVWIILVMILLRWLGFAGAIA